MRVCILSLIAAASVVTAQSYIAPVVTDNFPGAAFIADFPDQNKDSVLNGKVTGSSLTGTTGVKWTINVDNLPEAGGPFSFHVHKAPVPADGNCSGTLSHLDPYGRGDDPPCDSNHKNSCEVGDLSGKYGKIPNGTHHYETTFVDQYVSTNQNNVAYFGNLSITFHYANKTRFACANFISGGEEPEPTPACSTSTAAMATGVSSSYAAPTGAGGHGHNSSAPTGAASPTAPGLPEYTNAASKFISGAGAVVGFAAALLL